MSNVTRRKFLKDSVILAGGSAALGAVGSPRRAHAKEVGANDRIRIAVAGIHGQGGSHISDYCKMEGVEIAYLIDPDRSLWDGRLKEIEEATGQRPTCVTDFRKALDDDSLDAISIATPHHWHTPISLWACQAGKDVFVEKPMSHNFREGRMLVEAAKKYGRIVQHGTQSRHHLHWKMVMAIIASGQCGKLKISRGLCYKASGGRGTRGSIGYAPHKQPPEQLDFNIWLGPAPKQAYHENIVHYRWHWFWDFGNGDLGNQGVHQMDIARWAIPGAKLPKAAFSMGGRLGYQDQGEVASTQLAVYDYGDVKLVFETRGLPSERYKGIDIGNIMHCEGGDFIGDTFHPHDSDKVKKIEDFDDVGVKPWEGGNIRENFIHCVRTRDESELCAPAIEGHYSSALCHFANISHRTGGKVPFRPRTPELEQCDAAAEGWGRMEAYLETNGLDLETSGYTLGRKLVIDSESETIADKQANALMGETCREGFELPKI